MEWNDCGICLLLTISKESMRNSISAFWDFHSQHVIIVEWGGLPFSFFNFFSCLSFFFFSLCHLPPLWGLFPSTEKALTSPKMRSGLCVGFQHTFSCIFTSFQLGSDSSERKIITVDENSLGPYVVTNQKI